MSSREEPKIVGKKDPGNDVRPHWGVALTKGAKQSVRHPSGVAGAFEMPDPRLFGATPLDRWMGNGHPKGVLRLPLFTMS